MDSPTPPGIRDDRSEFPFKHIYENLTAAIQWDTYDEELEEMVLGSVVIFLDPKRVIIQPENQPSTKYVVTAAKIGTVAQAGGKVVITVEGDEDSNPELQKEKSLICLASDNTTAMNIAGAKLVVSGPGRLVELYQELKTIVKGTSSPVDLPFFGGQAKPGEI